MANPPADPLLTSVPKALELGWTMATLYNPPAHFGAAGVDHLRTEHELDNDERRDVELQRLTCLLSDLRRTSIATLGDASTAATNARTAWTTAAPGNARDSKLKTDLVTLNLQLLQGLACAGDEVELAYQVGRSLRDTSSLPPPADGAARTADQLSQAFVAILGRERITTLQQWLETLAPHLPLHSARVVSVSLGRWSALVGASLDTFRPGSLKSKKKATGPFRDRLTKYLLRQGDVWLQLLTGTKTTQGMLDPEGYVAAGELALRRTTKIVLRIVRHYWVALVVLAAAVGGILYLSTAYLGGPGKVWTSIAAIATSLGVTAKGIGSAMARMAKTAETPIFGLEEEDVMAWSITAIPPVRLNRSGIRAIRQAGIAPSTRLLRRATASQG